MASEPLVSALAAKAVIRQFLSDDRDEPGADLQMGYMRRDAANDQFEPNLVIYRIRWLPSLL
ncbi:hypothetical protein [Ruegeria arenilitoris]|uniref:hypothetical protein n=1 Tax=Ruegeria arenilitoris TaxID=1173585 RepID=UPI00147FE053|nr:hypothetical protein [Ruegeria arenilitoris]